MAVEQQLRSGMIDRVIGALEVAAVVMVELETEHELMNVQVIGALAVAAAVGIVEPKLELEPEVMAADVVVVAVVVDAAAAVGPL